MDLRNKLCFEEVCDFQNPGRNGNILQITSTLKPLSVLRPVESKRNAPDW